MSASNNGSSRPERVVILGGGFAGLEAAFNLRMRAGRDLPITLVNDGPDFLFKPNTIYIPFGLDPAKLHVPLASPLAKRGIEFVRDRAVGIDTGRQSVQLERGSVEYDRLVIATGSAMRAEEIPGLAEHALTCWTPAEMLQLRSAFNSLLTAGTQRRVLFLVPPNNKCAGPLYEIVLMLETWLRRRRVRDRVEIEWATVEPSYIHAFGPRLHDVVTDEFARRGISGRTSHVVARVEAGEVHYENGRSSGYDLLVAFPPYIASTPFEGLPADDRGFLSCELASRKVAGLDNVFAAGDAGDFPVKQAFLAFLQADAVAATLAHETVGIGEAAAFDPVSMCVMEQFDKATFAQVPLRLTGNPADPIEVRPEAADDYKVGSSLAWRGGKKMLGFAVPWRFRNGHPFHAGAFWSGMDLGLKGMSAVLAK